MLGWSVWRLFWSLEIAPHSRYPAQCLFYWHSFVLSRTVLRQSTLLAALSSTTLQSSGLEFTGAVWTEKVINSDRNNSREIAQKEHLSSHNGKVAFLHQSDAFFSMLTPRETLDLAAYLQLSGCDGATRRQIVDSVLAALGLTSVADRTVGGRSLDGGMIAGGGRGGLSGGERRRLSLAVELITEPRVFFGDEPTTGEQTLREDLPLPIYGQDSIYHRP